MFFEDSRIVSKNRIHNIAYELLCSLRDSGLSDQEIMLNMHNMYIAPHITNIEIRNDIYKEIVKIIGRSCEATST